jgi:hypothetical protein
LEYLSGTIFAKEIGHLFQRSEKALFSGIIVIIFNIYSS